MRKLMDWKKGGVRVIYEADGCVKILAPWGKKLDDKDTHDLVMELFKTALAHQLNEGLKPMVDLAKKLEEAGLKP